MAYEPSDAQFQPRFVSLATYRLFNRVKAATDQTKPQTMLCHPTKCPNACIHARHLPAWQKAEADAKALLKEKRLSVIQRESLKSERARIRDVIGQVSTES